MGEELLFLPLKVAGETVGRELLLRTARIQIEIDSAELLLVREQQIAGDEGAEKAQRARPVGQRMVELEIDPTAEIGEIEEQRLFVRQIESGTGGTVLLVN